MAKNDTRQDVTIELPHERGYRVLFTSLSEVSDLLLSLSPGVKRSLVITDENVGSLYANTLVQSLEASGVSAETITVPAGETTKSAEYLLHIYDSALSWGVERGTYVLVLGGGVVGDLGGFAAATLLRGLPLIQIPTTLVAQVDSAIGGKTAINHERGKNLIGAFYQPQAVLVDTSTLQSLPEREWMSGLAEVVKHGLIGDVDLVDFLEQQWPAVAERDSAVIDQLIPRAASVKARVVSADEREDNLRAILNFGHTFGHAIEKVTGYGTFTHGEAVAAGMRAAIHLSHAVHADLDARRADELVAKIPVPTGMKKLAVSDLMNAMRSDKKVRAGRLRLVLLNRIGEAYTTTDVQQSDIESAWHYVQEVVG